MVMPGDVVLGHDGAVVFIPPHLAEKVVTTSEIIRLRDTFAHERLIVTLDGPMVKDGFIPLSKKPRIGVEINEEGMRKYAPKGVPFFE